MRLSKDKWKMNLLCAFPYFKEDVTKELESQDPNSYNLIVDSGAFSAYNVGMEIDFDEYCQFLFDLKKRLPKFHAVQLDVVFDHEATEENFKKQRAMGLDVCPVFTRGAPSQYFLDLLEQDEYVFVGGVQGGAGAKEFAKWCLERSRGKKVHYLAFVRPEFLKYYEPFSTDSSSWAGAARFANLSLYAGNGKMKSVNKTDFITKPSDQIIQMLLDTGFTYSEIKYLAKADAWRNSGKFNYKQLENLEEDHSSLATFVNVVSYLRFSKMYEERTGTKVYQAIASGWQAKTFFSAYKFMQLRGLL